MKPKKLALFCLSLLPLVWLVYLGATAGLGANPVEYVVRFLGDWGLRFLLITLTVTPLRLLTKNNSLAQYRRMLGLFAFFYVMLHFTVFFAADMSFSFPALWKEVVKRLFITAGMGALLILIALAATSFNAIIKKMGAARWKKLHSLIYPAALLAVLHYYWMAKADKFQPLLYTAILAALLLFRLYKKYAPKF